MEYCSTVPPLQQVVDSKNQPVPSVLVPVSVLKREGIFQCTLNSNLFLCKLFTMFTIVLTQTL